MKIADLENIKDYQSLPTIKNARIYRTKKRKLPELIENQHTSKTLIAKGGGVTYEIPPQEYREFSFGAANFHLSWQKEESTGDAYLDSLRDA